MIVSERPENVRMSPFETRKETQSYETGLRCTIQSPAGLSQRHLTHSYLQRISFEIGCATKSKQTDIRQQHNEIIHIKHVVSKGGGILGRQLVSDLPHIRTAKLLLPPTCSTLRFFGASLSVWSHKTLRCKVFASYFHAGFIHLACVV